MKSLFWFLLGAIATIPVTAAWAEPARTVYRDVTNPDNYLVFPGDNIFEAWFYTPDYVLGYDADTKTFLMRGVHSAEGCKGRAEFDIGKPEHNFILNFDGSLSPMNKCSRSATTAAYLLKLAQ